MQCQNSWPWECGYNVIFQRFVNINSASETFDVNIVTDLGLTDVWQETVNIDVEFTETLTKKKAVAADSFSIVRYAYKVISTGESTFAPKKMQPGMMNNFQKFGP